MARRCVALVLVLAAVLVANGCRHRRGSDMREAYPAYSPVIVGGGCGCGCPCGGPAMSGPSYHGGGHQGGGDCGCGGGY